MSIEEMEITIEDRKKKIEDEKIEQENSNLIEIASFKVEMEKWGLDYDNTKSLEENQIIYEARTKEEFFVTKGSTHPLNYIEYEKHKDINEKYKVNKVDLPMATVDPEDVYNYLIDNEKEDENGNIIGHNFTDAQARAIINNIMAESGFEVGAIHQMGKLAMGNLKRLLIQILSQKKKIRK